jgi:hypothetical protein
MSATTFACECGKEFTLRTNLSRHRKTCPKNTKAKQAITTQKRKRGNVINYAEESDSDSSLSTDLDCDFSAPITRSTPEQRAPEQPRALSPHSARREMMEGRNTELVKLVEIIHEIKLRLL